MLQEVWHTYPDLRVKWQNSEAVAKILGLLGSRGKKDLRHLKNNQGLKEKRKI